MKEAYEMKLEADEHWSMPLADLKEKPRYHNMIRDIMDDIETQTERGLYRACPLSLDIEIHYPRLKEYFESYGYKVWVETDGMGNKRTHMSWRDSE